MALSPSRRRTQTALTSFAEKIANVHGELAFLEGLASLKPQQLEVVQHRRAVLLRMRDALYGTLRRFAPELSPEDIGAAGDWMKPFGRKVTTRTVRRYLGALSLAA